MKAPRSECGEALRTEMEVQKCPSHYKMGSRPRGTPPSKRREKAPTHLPFLAAAQSTPHDQAIHRQRSKVERLHSFRGAAATLQQASRAPSGLLLSLLSPQPVRPLELQACA